MGLNLDDERMPDLAGYGNIADIALSKEQAVQLKISDVSVPGKESTFELDENHSLTEALVEMKAIGMPLAVVRAPAGSATRYCFLGALPLQVMRVEELAHPHRLEGEFDSAFGTNFVVNGTNPYFLRIKQRLEEALKQGRAYWIILAASSKLQRQLVIDVLDPFELPQSTVGQAFDDEYDEAGLYPITPAKATEIFESFESTSPTSGPLTGIPFKYVFEGCEVRSHQMVKQILARKEHIQPIKVWAFPFDVLFKLKTENSPLNCEVRWAFHTAPALITTSGVLVIDPSIGSGPEPVATWFSHFETNNSKLYYTSHHVYLTKNDFNKVFESDPQYLKSDLLIRIYRVHLRLQTCLFGPPPYT